AALAALAVTAPGPADAADAALYSIHAEVAPSVLHLGERAIYRGWVIVPHGEPVSWIRPQTSGALSWGPAVVRRSRRAGDGAGPGGVDTVRVEAPLQVFALGRVSIPGLHLRLPFVSGVNQPSEHVLPVARVAV